MSLRELVFPHLRLRAAIGALFAPGGSNKAAGAVVPSTIIGLVVAFGYYVGCQVGFLLKPSDSPIATFWPPNAILLAALLLAPRRIWWVLLVAVLPAHLLAQLGAGVPLSSALSWFVGNAGEALLGAACVRVFKKGDELFDSVRGVIVFLSCGVLVPTLTTSFVDAAGVVLTGLGREFWALWTIRLTSNIVADVTIVPTIVIVGAHGLSWLRRASTARYYEIAALMISAIVVGYLAFGRESSMRSFWPFIYALLPLICWALLRFGTGGVSASLLITALITFWYTTQGRGPFGLISRELSVLLLHFLLTVLSVSFLFASALLAERQSEEKTVRAKFGSLVHAQELDHYRIARELHDDILQRLTLVSLHLDQLRTASLVFAKPPFNTLYDQISDISNKIRDLSHEVHPFMLEYLGLSRALRKLCRDASAQSGIAISFSERGVALPLPLDVSGCLFRVAQEAVQNIAKHSIAKTAVMELDLASRSAVLRVSDSGCGLDGLRTENVGTTYLREQILTLEGTLEITSAASKGTEGTTIEVSLPIQRVA
jgi:signal transduction histidine kinase